MAIWSPVMKNPSAADAMTDRAITQPLYYITSELFLRPAANADQQMRRAAFPNISRNVDASCRSLCRKVPSVKFA